MFGLNRAARALEPLRSEGEMGSGAEVLGRIGPRCGRVYGRRGPTS